MCELNILFRLKIEIELKINLRISHYVYRGLVSDMTDLSRTCIVGILVSDSKGDLEGEFAHIHRNTSQGSMDVCKIAYKDWLCLWIHQVNIPSPVRFHKQSQSHTLVCLVVLVSVISLSIYSCCHETNVFERMVEVFTCLTTTHLEVINTLASLLVHLESSSCVPRPLKPRNPPEMFCFLCDDIRGVVRFRTSFASRMYVLYKDSTVLYWYWRTGLQSMTDWWWRTLLEPMTDCLDIYTWTNREFDLLGSKHHSCSSLCMISRATRMKCSNYPGPEEIPPPAHECKTWNPSMVHLKSVFSRRRACDLC